MKTNNAIRGVFSLVLVTVHYDVNNNKTYHFTVWTVTFVSVLSAIIFFKKIFIMLSKLVSFFFISPPRFLVYQTGQC